MAKEWRQKGQSARNRLRQCRRRIDTVDRAIAALLRERVRLALSAGRIKLAAGQPLVAPEREMAVLARVRKMCGTPLGPERVLRIFQTIIHETREAETQLLGRQAKDGPG